MRRITLESFVAGGLLVLAALAWFQTNDILPQAALFPRLSIALLALFAGIYLIRSLARPRTQEDGLFAHRGRFLSAFVLILAYVSIFPRLGYFTTSALFIPAFAAAMGMRRWKLIGAATLAFIVVMYVLFIVVLDRRLPEDLVVGFLQRGLNLAL